MAFESSVARDDEGRAEITITVDAVQVDKAIADSYKKLAKKMRIPGFRPGKAPRSVIEGQLGRDYVLVEALEALVNETYPLAVDKEQLRTAGKVDFNDPQELVEGESYTYTVSVPLRPELSLKSDEVSITITPREATEAEIDQQIEGTIERFAQYPAVEDKDAKVANDSFVTISFTSSLDGEDYEGSEVTGHLYQMGQGMMPPAFDEGLVGAKAGDTVAVEFVVEDRGDNAEYAGKTMHFDVTIDEINEKKLPEIDDDFAAQVGFDGIEGMRKEIASYIDTQKAQSWERMRDDRLIAALAEHLEGEPTPELIEARADSMIEEFSRILEKSEMTLEGYLEHSGMDEEQYRADMEEQAAITVANDLALEALARDKDLVPDDEKLAEEFEKAAEDADETAEALRSSWEKQGMLTVLRDDLSRRDAMEWLRENAEIIISEEELI